MIKEAKDDSLNQFLDKLKKLKGVDPDPIFRENARIRLLNKISNPKVQKNIKIYGYRFAFLTVVLFLLIGTGAVYAAQSSLPGNPLYPVKTASEKVALTIAPTDLKTFIQAEIVKRRENEQKQTEKIQTEVKNLESKNLNEMLLTPTPQISKAVQTLQSAIEKAPNQAIEGLTKAVESVSKQERNNNEQIQKSEKENKNGKLLRAKTP